MARSRYMVVVAAAVVLAGCGSVPDLPSYRELSKTPEPTPSVNPQAWENVDPEEIRLEHHFKPGQRAAYEVQRTYVVDRGRPGAEGDASKPQRLIDAEDLVRYDVRVEAVDQWGGARLRITPTRLEIDREGPDGREVELDTEDGGPTGDPELDAEAQRVGRPLRAQIDQRGRLLSLDGPDAFLADVAGQLPVVRRWDALEDFEERLGTRGLLRRLQELFVILPDKVLQPGDSWEELLPTGNPELEGNGHFRQTYVYLGLVDYKGDRCAKIFFWRVFSGVEQDGHGQRVWVPPHAAQGSLYLRVSDGQLLGSEPLREERLVVRRDGRQLTIFRSQNLTEQELVEDW